MRGLQEEAVKVLEEIILPSFDEMIRLEEKKTIVAGELDQMLRTLPMWGTLDWEVTALQTFAGRAAQERSMVKELKR